MKSKLTFILAIMASDHLYARTNANLVLRGFVASSVKTKITQTQLSSQTSLVTFSSQINGKYFREGQKFEILGLEQSGLDATLRAVTGSDRTVQYELLVKHLKETMPTHRPIFLNISAN